MSCWLVFLLMYIMGVLLRVTVIEQTGAPSISVSLATNHLMIPVARGQVYKDYLM